METRMLLDILSKTLVYITGCRQLSDLLQIVTHCMSVRVKAPVKKTIKHCLLKYSSIVSESYFDSNITRFLEFDDVYNLFFRRISI